jgi:hypothetical protein
MKMEDWTFDMTGEISLLEKHGRESPINSGYWGTGGIDPNLRQDSYLIQLIGKDNLSPGEKCRAYFRFKFIDDPRFGIQVEENDIITLCEGHRKIGAFRVEKILNEKIRKAHNTI